LNWIFGYKIVIIRKFAGKIFGYSFDYWVINVLSLGISGKKPKHYMLFYFISG
jgi:hypothetical protein